MPMSNAYMEKTRPRNLSGTSEISVETESGDEVIGAM